MSEFSSQRIQVGISACLLGQEVRYDGGHKQSRFCRYELTEYFDFQPICPEMAIGMGTPRKTIRLVEDDQRIRLQASDGSIDVTESMEAFSEQQTKRLSHLSGYVVCAKSPSCGMERVSVYSPAKNNASRDGVGLFTAKLMANNPLLPVEEDGRLNDAILRENFISRVYAYHDWQCMQQSGLTVSKIMQFHSRYKYLLMAHNPERYRQLGPVVANLSENDQAGFERYIIEFMAIMKHNISRKNHCNVLQHLQGYFKKQLSSEQRQELADHIINYKKGMLPLLAPVVLLQHYLREHPNDYLSAQVYLNPHPMALRLRYSL